MRRAVFFFALVILAVMTIAVLVPGNSAEAGGPPFMAKLSAASPITPLIATQQSDIVVIELWNTTSNSIVVDRLEFSVATPVAFREFSLRSDGMIIGRARANSHNVLCFRNIRLVIPGNSVKIVTLSGLPRESGGPVVVTLKDGEARTVGRKHISLFQFGDKEICITTWVIDAQE